MIRLINKTVERMETIIKITLIFIFFARTKSPTLNHQGPQITTLARYMDKTFRHKGNTISGKQYQNKQQMKYFESS